MTEEEIQTIVSRVVAQLQDVPTPSPQAVTLGHFSVAPGDTILADHVNSLSDMSIPKFASATARDASWPTPPSGAVCWLEDVNWLEVYSDSIVSATKIWHPVGGLRMGYGYMGVSQVITNNTPTLLKLGSAGGAAGKAGRGSWNSDGTVSPPLLGTYLVSASVTWPTNTVGERRVYIQKRLADGVTWSNSGVAGGIEEDLASGVGQVSGMYQSTSAMMVMNTGERIGLRVHHTAGVSLTMPTSGNCRLAVHMLGAD